jgi:uncharacterized protein (TIGR02246 family)
MRNLLIIASLLFFISYTSKGQSNDIEIVKKLNLNWLNTFPTRDSAVLGKILADDFILITPQGAKEGKKENLLNLMSPQIEFISVIIDSVNVRLLSPDIAVLNAWTSFLFKFEQKENRARNCYQDIYMKRKGKWQAIMAHVSSINTQK